jgi:hypothetical protein
MDLPTYYGIVSYAVGVSLILSIAGIKSGRRFFLLHRRHSGRRSAGYVLGHDGRANHHPPPQEQEPLDGQELVDLAGGLDLARRYLTEDFEAGQESGRGTDRRSAPSTSKIIWSVFLSLFIFDFDLFFLFFGHLSLLYKCTHCRIFEKYICISYLLCVCSF